MVTLYNLTMNSTCDIWSFSEDLLKDPVLPLAEKCRKKVEAMFHKEESCRQVKHFTLQQGDWWFDVTFR